LSRSGAMKLMWPPARVGSSTGVLATAVQQAPVSRRPATQPASEAGPLSAYAAFRKQFLGSRAAGAQDRLPSADALPQPPKWPHASRLDVEPATTTRLTRISYALAAAHPTLPQPMIAGVAPIAVSGTSSQQSSAPARSVIRTLSLIPQARSKTSGGIAEADERHVILSLQELLLQPALQQETTGAEAACGGGSGPTGSATTVRDTGEFDPTAVGLPARPLRPALAQLVGRFASLSREHLAGPAAAGADASGVDVEAALRGLTTARLTLFTAL